MSEVLMKKDVDPTLLSISTALESTSVITPNDLRLALMDYVDVNIPLYKEHLTDQQLWKCIKWACEHFNEVQPRISKEYDITNFPRPKLLLDAALVEALRLTTLVELRGEMQYSDGGVQSSIYYKSQHFSALRQELEQKVEQQIMSVKRSLNINNCYGVLC